MTQVLEIKQGIWIDEQLLHRAGMGKQWQVLVQPGEIRIVPMAASGAQPSPEGQVTETVQTAWEVFRSLGRKAMPGKLPSAAMEHDRYLYGTRR